MKLSHLLAGAGALGLLTASSSLYAQTSRYDALANAPFKGDYPTAETAQLLNDELYHQRAVQVGRRHVGQVITTAKVLKALREKL